MMGVIFWSAVRVIEWALMLIGIAALVVVF